MQDRFTYLPPSLVSLSSFLSPSLSHFSAPSISTSLSPPLPPSPSYLFSTSKLSLNFVRILGAKEQIWMQSQDVRYSLLVCPGVDVGELNRTVDTLPYTRHDLAFSNIYLEKLCSLPSLYFSCVFLLFLFLSFEYKITYPVRNFLEN